MINTKPALCSPLLQQAKAELCETSTRNMFPVAKVNKKTAYRQLQQHLLALGAWVAAIRALPYVLQALQDAQR